MLPGTMASVLLRPIARLGAVRPRLLCFRDLSTSESSRLSLIRNVGIFAHVDAGKTTITENLLSLSKGVSPGSVDAGSTTTDFLPQERERGITIQSAVVSLQWSQNNNKVNLIDTPGHVDFSVEIARSVAVLDGAVLVVDGVEGVQAQTETVWNAMQLKTLSSAAASPGAPGGGDRPAAGGGSRLPTATPAAPLPCVAVVNKLDRVGADYYKAVGSIERRLKRNGNLALDKGAGGNKARAIPVHVPLIKCERSGRVLPSFPGLPSVHGEFVGILDLLSSPLRSLVWGPIGAGGSAPLLEIAAVDAASGEGTYLPACSKAHLALVESLADVSDEVSDFYLAEETPPADVLVRALRKATVENRAMPVLAAAALKRKGIEPILDAICNFLPSPLDRPPPSLIRREEAEPTKKSKGGAASAGSSAPPIGHPLNDTLLALAFKVVHAKGRGGGDGRIVFARVFSGTLHEKKSIKASNTDDLLSMSAKDSAGRAERPAALLLLNAGKFEHLQSGACPSGEVCAIVGLKDVVTGDTIVLSGDKATANICLGGVTAPKPVLTVRLEPETSEDERKMEEALRILSVEDPSLRVDLADDGSTNVLLSGLGELHIEIAVDRMKREFGVEVRTGTPTVSYRETLSSGTSIDSNGPVNYDRTIAGKRLQASVGLRMTLIEKSDDEGATTSLVNNAVVLSDEVRSFLQVRESDEFSDCVVALVEGAKGALKRGPVSGFEMTNVRCVIESVDSEGGLAGAMSNPGALRAAAANAVFTTLKKEASNMCVLEPIMKVEVSAKEAMIGTVLSDFTNRRGNVKEVGRSLLDDERNIVNGEIPLKSILGYATSLRSLTGGEGQFTAEYLGHARRSD